MANDYVFISSKSIESKNYCVMINCITIEKAYHVFLCIFSSHCRFSLRMVEGCCCCSLQSSISLVDTTTSCIALGFLF